MGNPREGLETVARAFALLDCFEGGAPMSLAELSRASGLPKPTTLRFARKLVELEMLEQDDAGYRLGLRLLELGSRVDQQRELRERALPYLQHIFSATQHIVHLAVRSGSEIVFIERLRSRSGSELPSQLGARMPMHSTALGKALLAHAPDDLVERVLSLPLEPMTPRTQRDPAVLALELEAIRRDGIANSREECMPGLRCVAAPIFDASGVTQGALSISAYRQRFDRDAMANVARRAARAVERELGSAPV